LERAQGAIEKSRTRIQLLIQSHQVSQPEISHRISYMILGAWMAPEAIKIDIPFWCLSV
jgi:hypothetical protein